MTSTQGDFAQALAGQAQQQTVSIANQISVASLKHVQNAGTTVDASIRSSLNLIQGTGVTLTIADNAVSDRVDVTIATSTVFPGTKLDYKTITSAVTVNATTEGTANTVITGNSVTYTNNEVEVKVMIPDIVLVAGLPTSVMFVVLRDSTVLGHVAKSGEGAGAGGGIFSAMEFTTFDTPSAGAHVYTVKAYVDAGSVTCQAGSGGSGNYVPAFLRVKST